MPGLAPACAHASADLHAPIAQHTAAPQEPGRGEPAAQSLQFPACCLAPTGRCGWKRSWPSSTPPRSLPASWPRARAGAATPARAGGRGAGEGGNGAAGGQGWHRQGSRGISRRLRLLASPALRRLLHSLLARPPPPLPPLAKCMQTRQQTAPVARRAPTAAPAPRCGRAAMPRWSPASCPTWLRRP